MSAVLKALRRLEAENPSGPRLPAAAWLDQPEADRGRWRRLGQICRDRRPWWLPAAAVLAAAAAIWLSGGAADPRPALPPAAPSTPAASRPVADADPLLRQPPGPAGRPARQPPPQAVMPWARSGMPEAATPVAPPPAPEPAPSADLWPPPAAAGLTLQAISWAARPERRIAVVSGQILHVGDDIDGFVVREIVPDAVIVCRAGPCFRLVFSTPR
jgi:hypothetical protein